MTGEKGEREAEYLIEKARIEGATQLDLSLIGLIEVPKGIANLTQLQQLNLSGNQIEEIPDAIANLTLLQGLDLHNNQIKELPDACLLYTSPSPRD